MEILKTIWPRRDSCGCTLGSPSARMNDFLRGRKLHFSPTNIWIIWFYHKILLQNPANYAGEEKKIHFQFSLLLQNKMRALSSALLSSSPLPEFQSSAHEAAGIAAGFGGRWHLWMILEMLWFRVVSCLKCWMKSSLHH